MSDSTRSGGKRPAESSAADKNPYKRPRSNSTSTNGNPVHSNRGPDMFADFDFRSKPQIAHSPRASMSDANGQKKKPTFKVPNPKELMDAFSSPMTDLSTAKPQPKLPPKSSVSIHDQLRLRKPPIPVSPLRIANGGCRDAEKGKGKERQMTPLRAPQLVYPADEDASGATKEKRLVTPITSRTYKLDDTPARKVVPLNSLFGLPKADTGFPSSSSANTPDASLWTLPGPKFSLGGGTKVPKTPLRGVTPAPFEVFVKPEGQPNAGEEGEDERTRELNRGLLVSPEKESGRGRKFIRNGLAERAQHLITRSQTAFTLWSRDLESSSRSSSTRPMHSSALATSSIRQRPDIRLRLLSVSHISRTSNVHSRSSGSSIRSILARCLILSGPPELSSLTVLPFNNDASVAGRSGTPMRETPPASHVRSQTLEVLFSFHAHEQSDFALRLLGLSEHIDGSHIPVGCEVHVWKPWYITSALPSSSSAIQDKTEDVAEDIHEEREVFSTPPKRSKSSSTGMKAPPTILCSRFLVIPSAPKATVPP